MSNRQQPVTRQRAISCKVTPETDHDILDWWDSLPKSQRGDTLRHAIRQFVANGNSPDFSSSEAVADLREEIRQEMRLAIDEMGARLADEVTELREVLSQAIQDMTQRLAREVGELRQAIVQGVHAASQNSHNGNGNSPTANYDGVEPEALRLSDEDLEKRKAKLLNRRW